MEVDIPSSISKALAIGAILCATCTMHSAAAQDHAESQTSSWSSLFGCAKKDKISEIAGISGSTYVGSNLLTEKRAHTLAQGLLGGSAAEKVAPHIYSVAKSARWKAVSGLMAISAFSLHAYQFVWCE